VVSTLRLVELGQRLLPGKRPGDRA
jgi:hypothetical protein